MSILLRVVAVIISYNVGRQVIDEFWVSLPSGCMYVFSSVRKDGHRWGCLIKLFLKFVRER